MMKTSNIQIFKQHWKRIKTKNSTQIFVDAIENYCNNGSGYKRSSIMGMYCNINKLSPLRGVDLPQYFKDKMYHKCTE